MKLPKYLILSLVHCLIITTSSDSNCQPSFSCGNLSLSFPFTDIQKPECGLFPVDGCNSEDEPLNVQLESGRFRYDILHAQPGTNKLCVEKEELLKRSPISLGNVSPPYILAFHPGNPILLVCKTNISQGKSPSQPGKSYNKTISASFIICREVKADGFPDSDEVCHPECSRIQEPVLKLDTQAGLFLFEWLSTDCTLAWHISDNSSLTNAKKESSWLLLILGGGLLLILVCLLLALYIIRLRRKIINLSYLHSRKISLVPSLSEIDGGSSFFGIPVFSYKDLEIATNNFDPSKILGDGGFGTVYYGKLRDGREVAIKRLYEQNCRRVEQFINEIKILTSLRNPHLVTLYGCTSRRSRELLLVYEYIPNGTVTDHLHGDRVEEAPLRWPTRMRVAIETAEALSYLHKSDIIHRDVKTDNILLDKNFHVKVADFGLSRLFPYDATHISTVPGGTPGYIDPDYHQCYQVTDKSDVYSFGVVLVELISSMPAVDISRQTHEINLANLAVNRIQRCAFDKLIDPSLGYNVDVEVTRMTTSVAEIAFRCLQPQKEMRPSMGEVLAFLKDI